MILVLKPDATPEQIEHVMDHVRESGFTPYPIIGEFRTIIGVVGDDTKPQTENFHTLPGIEQVLPILKPFKLASREYHKADSVVEIGTTKIGGGHLGVIAGPCAVENFDFLDTIARRVKAAGANLLRGGAFKPRTSPYSFQGLGEEGLQMLRAAGDKYGIPIVTEVMDTRQVDLVCRYADMLQIGARNMQNFDLLKEAGQTGKPILLKRGMSATVKDLLMSAEYILAAAGADRQVVLCERGVRSFEDSTRNMLDLASVPNIKGQSHLPVIVDPSHATGRPDLIPPMARAAVAAGADGVHVEVHCCPEKALSDGPQALLPDQFDALMKDIRRIAVMFEKKLE
jgi:3-deoxy-7-phosphoheptulonate synthase